MTPTPEHLVPHLQLNNVLSVSRQPSLEVLIKMIDMILQISLLSGATVFWVNRFAGRDILCCYYWDNNLILAHYTAGTTSLVVSGVFKVKRRGLESQIRSTFLIAAS